MNKWGAIRDVSSQAEWAQIAACLGDSDGNVDNNVDTSNWDWGTYQPADESYEYMSGNPHIVKLVPNTVTTDNRYQPAYYHLVWGSKKESYANYSASLSNEYGNVFWLASPPVSETETYSMFATDGVAEIIYYDSDLDGDLNVTGEPRVTATFTQGSRTVYTSYDVACETAGNYIHLPRG